METAAPRRHAHRHKLRPSAGRGVPLVFAGVMIVAGRDPEAGLGGVFLGLGMILAVAAALFTFAAVLVLRAGPTRHGSLSWS